MGCQLWPDRAWYGRSSRRPPAHTQTTQGLWTCGQRLALPTRPTAPTTTDLNETGIVLPMSSVRSVTYVPGCSGKGWSEGLRSLLCEPPHPTRVPAHTSGCYLVR